MQERYRSTKVVKQLSDSPSDPAINADEHDINLTNQLIGEVQAFIHVMRWLVYEFYGFRSLKQGGYLKAVDFEAIEEDVLFLIHKKTVYKEVHETLIVMMRLLNNVDDKMMRTKFKNIAAYKGKFFPLEQDVYISGDMNAEQ